MGYDLWGCKESHMTEVIKHSHTHTHTHTHTHRGLPWVLASIIIGLYQGSYRSLNERHETDLNLDHILSRTIPENLRDLANK